MIHNYFQLIKLESELSTKLQLLIFNINYIQKESIIEKRELLCINFLIIFIVKLLLLIISNIKRFDYGKFTFSSIT